MRAQPERRARIGEEQASAKRSGGGQHHNSTFGGFGGLSVGYSQFAKRDAADVCVEGSLLIDHAFSFGGIGCGIAPNIRTTELDATANPDYRTSFGYGGGIVRYRLTSRRYFSLFVGGLIGAGGIVSGDWYESEGHQARGSRSPDFVFVVEPQLSAYVHVTRWLRVGAAGGYRFVAGVDTRGLSNSDVQGPSLSAQVQLGWF